MKEQLKNFSRLVMKLWRLNYEAYSDFKERRRYLNRSPEFWRRLPQYIFEESVPVFFLSTGRCGTALVSKILDRIPGVACFHKPTPELVYSERMAYQEGLEKLETYETAIRTARFELIADCVVREKVYVETSCRITFFAPHLCSLFPQSRFVHLVRHPGAFVRSAVRWKYYEGSYTDIGRIRPYAGPVYNAWPTMSPFERAAWLWNETNLYIEQFKDKVAPDRMLTVKAEDLFRDPEAAISIVDHCGLQKPDRDFVSKCIRRPVNAYSGSSSLAPYAAWDERLKDDVRRWVTCEDRYGYQL
jgi:hypothetical protein